MGTMELLDGWTIGLLDNLHLSVNYVKSVKPSQMFYIQMIFLLFHICLVFHGIVGQLDGWTLEQFVFICKFCKISKTITNIFYSNDIFIVSELIVKLS